MKKMTFFLGTGIGFILGSFAGRGPYETLESKVTEIIRRPGVRDKTLQLRRAATDQVTAVAGKVRWPQQSAADQGDGTVGAPDPAPQSYVDPQDLQFSTTAARKQEMVDDLLAQGVAPEQLDEKEQTLRDTGVLIEPRAGNKAKPV